MFDTCSFKPTNDGFPPSSGGGAVTSVFGRTGVVIAVAGDYTSSEITNSSTVTGTYVTDALNTLDTGKLSTTLTNGNIIVGNGSNVATAVAMSGDATIINTGALTISNQAVTFAKMQHISSQHLVGRHAAGSGDIQQISLGTGLSFSGANLQVTGFVPTTLTSANIIVGNNLSVATAVAMSGDTTISNTGAVTISNDAVTTAKILNSNVTYAKVQNVSTNDRLLGRATAGAGVLEEITLGTNLSITGTTLNAAGGGGYTYLAITLSANTSYNKADLAGANYLLVQTNNTTTRILTIGTGFVANDFIVFAFADGSQGLITLTDGVNNFTNNRGNTIFALFNGTTWVFQSWANAYNSGVATTSNMSIGLGASSINGGIAIGRSASATNNDVSIGTTTTGTGGGSTRIGHGITTGTITGVVAIGQNITQTNTDNVIIGRGASASAANTIAIGVGSTGTGANCIRIGNSINTGGSAGGIVIGAGITAGFSGTDAIMIGRAVKTAGDNSITIGALIVGSGTNSIRIGHSANTSVAISTIAIGTSSNAQGDYSSVIGHSSTVSANSAIGIGAGVNIGTNALGSVAIGVGVTIDTGGANVVAIGRGASGGNIRGVSIGAFTKTVRNNSVRFRLDNSTSSTDATYPSHSLEFIGLMATTTNSTPTEMFVGNDGVSKITLQANNQLAFTGSCQAYKSTQDASAKWDFSGMIRRDGANNTSIVGTTVLTMVQSDGVGSGLILDITADDTTENLKFTARGNTGETWYWFADVKLNDLKIA